MAEPSETLPLDPIIGAQIVARLAHGLLTGPCAVAFMRQTPLGGGAELMAAQLMQTAETLAAEAIRRGAGLRCPPLAPELRDIFRQVQK